jgi:DNA-binding HxlR family transcriptional regulator
MRHQRTYGDRCGIARALDLVGERWALLVIRELLLGPKRFTDLRAGLPNVTADVLSQRLRELEQAGVVRRAKLPPPAASRVYELTEWGNELEPVVLGLGRWGSRAPFPSTDTPLGVDAFMLALKTMFDPSVAGNEDRVFELTLGENNFQVEVADGRLEIRRGNAQDPDAKIEGDPATLAQVLWHGGSLSDGRVKLEGSQEAARSFIRLFPAPQPVIGTPGDR